jgi:DNA topoisomerase-3
LVEPPASPALLAAIKRWRLTEAKRRRVPAFCVMDNQALKRIAAIRPDSDEKLLTIKGMGPARVKNYGPHIIELIKQTKPE